MSCICSYLPLLRIADPPECLGCEDIFDLHVSSAIVSIRHSVLGHQTWNSRMKDTQPCTGFIILESLTVDRHRHRFLGCGSRPSKAGFGRDTSPANQRCRYPPTVIENKWVHHFTTIQTVKDHSREDTHIIFQVHTGFFGHEAIAAETKHMGHLSPSPTRV